MKVESSQAQMLTITGAKALDPIRVVMEDIEANKGRITISCFTQSWVAYWGGTGERSVAKFFSSCNEHYLAGCLAPNLRSLLVDADSIRPAAIKVIREQRRSRELRAQEAREMFEAAESIDSDFWHHSEILQKVFGDDWRVCLPERPNPDYQYLCRIILAVQEAIRTADLSANVCELSDVLKG